MCLSSNLLSFLHSLGFNFYTSPVASPQLRAFILFQYLSFLPGAPQKLPAIIWFYIWFPRGLLKSPPPVPPSNFPHSCGFKIKASPLSSLHSFLHAPSFGFNIYSQQLLALILVSMSNFPLSHLPLSHQFSAVIWLQYLHVPPFLSTPSCMHLVSISKFPPPCASQQLPAFTFWSQNFPPRLWAILCMCLLLVSMASPLISQQLFNIPSPYVPLNFLRSFRFICKLPSIGLLTTSYLFVVSISELPLHQQLLACILSQYLNCPHLFEVQKTCTGSKKECAKVQKHPAQGERL